MKKAIVIGASSGIGRELSKVLRRHGYVVGVMARRVHLLKELQEESGGEDMVVEQIDVSDVDAARTKLKNLIEKMADVDLVVIAAGTGHLNPELQWHLERDTIATNVSGFTALANIAFKHFETRGSGHLAAISSIAAIRGGRQAPAYNASKAFISNYLEGLRQRIGRSRLPITITDIKPGFVDTGMARGEGIFWIAKADKAALQIYRAIERKKDNVYITRRWRMIAWLMKILPGSLYKRL